MQYDIALKSLLCRNSGKLFEAFTGLAPARWCNTEFPRTAATAKHVDLLAETANRELVHLELQSSNDPRMLRRMIEYAWLIEREYDRFPHQVVLYVGRTPMRMRSHARENGFHYRSVDIRNFDGKHLIESPNIEDNIAAILTKGMGNRETVHKVLENIAALNREKRADALQELILLSGLRNLGDTLEEEVQKVPIDIDIMENTIIAGAFKRGLEKGLQDGLEQGRQQSLQLLRRMLELRFGQLPTWIDHRVQDLSNDRIEILSTRVFHCDKLEDLFA